ncbi:MAG: hotdog domain-containing protein [Bacteroidales bacterium]|jgi:acyl-CoA hydrolase|nr:hotdog domain-containing protein [Bacteroidales bacterium]
MIKKIHHPVLNITMRLIKSEDLNHHGTLFAGRTAEWFVESGFIAAATLIDPKNIVCLKIHGMYFTSPAKPGEVLKFESKIVYTGTSSLVSYITVTRSGNSKPMVDGFITFIHVDEETRPMPHNIETQPVTEEDTLLYEQASKLKK